MSSNTSSSNNTWLAWFQSRESASLIDKSNQEKLFSTFQSTVSESECIDAILKHEETAYLQKVSFGEGRVNLFHHLIAVGGTIYDASTKEYGFIQGLGRSTAVAMTPDITVLCKSPTGAATATPSATQLLGVSTRGQVDALAVSATVTYKPRNFIPVPPFLLEVVHQSISKSNGEAKEILVDCVKAIKEFDAAHTNDAEYTDKARSKCKDMMFWLYLVSQSSDAVEAVPATGCNNESMAERLAVIAKKCLDQSEDISVSISTQVEKSLKRPFEVLAASSSMTSEFMEKLTQLQSQSSEKSSKSFKKIPAKYQHMILVASSVGEVTEVEYDADASELFKCSSTLNAQVMLNSQFEAEGIECSVSSAVTATLLYGSFLWKNALSPSGLAASVLTSEGIFRSDTLHDGMVLDFSTKFDMSASSLHKLTKTQVLFPCDIEETIHRLKALHVLARFFFKKSGYMSQGLKKLVNFCVDNKMLLRTRLYIDSKFIAKFICAVDERIYLWLKQCSIYAIVTDTDLSLMDFNPLVQDIQLNRFNYFLPPSISKIVNIEKEEANAPNKKKKSEVEKNLEMIREWKIRPGEAWETNFRNRMNDGPELSRGCKPCLKFHVKGICYTDCKHRKSHCVLQGEDKVKMSNYIKELRGE